MCFLWQERTIQLFSQTFKSNKNKELNVKNKKGLCRYLTYCASYVNSGKSNPYTNIKLMAYLINSNKFTVKAFQTPFYNILVFKSV